MYEYFNTWLKHWFNQWKLFIFRFEEKKVILTGLKSNLTNENLFSTEKKKQLF